MKLLSVEDARARMLAEIAPLAAEAVPLKAAIGRVTAQDVTAVRPQPPFTNSSMDGWALRAADAPGSLTIVGESAAGHGHEAPLKAGEAVRIFTGAALPAGADTVVIQENATREGDSVAVPAATPGDNVRETGRDFRTGDVLVAKALRLDPWRLSLCASAGRAEVLVTRRPRVALISTGEEIVEAPATPGPFQIYDAGSPALQAMVESWGGEASRITGVRDRLEAVIEALRGADADLIVTIGGASVGDHDLVRAAGEALGLEMKVASINVRPGKPTFFGTLPDGRRMLGLPGNPASAFVCAELFLKPILAAYQGTVAEPRMVLARASEAFGANASREHWMRAKLSFEDGALFARPYRDQDSSLVTVFAAADALLRRGPNAPAVAVGELVEVLQLDRA